MNKKLYLATNELYELFGFFKCGYCFGSCTLNFGSVCLWIETPEAEANESRMHNSLIDNMIGEGEIFMFENTDEAIIQFLG